jgi:dGTPase
MMDALAIYAAHESRSRGRVYLEAHSSHRGQYQRDRDRIVHSSAFRRLEYKTQVFVNHEGDMFRTRLTHSLEVSQIGRTVARSLSLNEDLTEAICLAHDLGHTPFGHAGQDALNQCMAGYGGFEHNLQSLRVVDQLEEKYADFPGLNLMYETREGILKHCSIINAGKLGDVGLRFINKHQPGLEAQIANIADEIAYNNHDVDDGLRAGLLSIEQLCECQLFREQHEIVKSRWPGLDHKRTRHELIRRMINKVVVDLIRHSGEMIKRFDPADIDAARHAGNRLIGLGEEIQQQHLQLKQFLYKNLYRHGKVMKMTENAAVIITRLFNRYMQDPAALSAEIRVRLEDAASGENTDTSRARIIADYIAGMTDRFAIHESERLGPWV